VIVSLHVATGAAAGPDPSEWEVEIAYLIAES
jgi:hypothetical protein